MKWRAILNQIAIGGLLVSSTTAQAECWNPTAVKAARVRTLETMMMVSALRCRMSQADILENYNQFIRGSRAQLDAVNGTLKGYFAKSGGLNAYDAYVTQLANKFGNGVPGKDCMAMSEVLREAVVAQGNMEAINKLVDRQMVIPVLTREGLCPVHAPFS